MTTPPSGRLLTYRQAAHACGLTVEQLRYLHRIGDASPAFQIDAPGGRGDYLWTVQEVTRIRDAKDKTAWRRRRKAALRGHTFDALRPVAPRAPRPRRLPDRPAP